ncbi:MAG: alpha/beta fold hydrolase [Pseudomonadota bacterium]
MSKPLHVVFSHGQESGPWGTKITAMAEVAKRAGLTVDSVDYRGIADPAERVNKLCAAYAADKRALLLVGSSMGGHVATAAASKLRPAGVFVLAPAYYVPGFEALTPPPPDCPLAIVHGWHDDVVPVDGVIRYAREAVADLHVIDGDHRLTANLPAINRLFEDFLRALA